MFIKNSVVALLFIVVVFLCSCSTVKKLPDPAPVAIAAVVEQPAPIDSTQTDAFLENILKQYPQYFDLILAHKKDWNVQFIYTKIDRGANGLAALKDYHFNLNAENYFYPASTVKLPVCILALQKLNELKLNGLDKNTTMITEQDYSGQSTVYNDPSTATGQPSIAQYIKKILMVSDNDAFNRLYEFLGQQYINDQLHKLGYSDVQILHRLNIYLSPDENRHTNPVKFLDNNNQVILDQPGQFNTTQYLSRTDSLGKAFYKGGQLIDEPMDFSGKNRISLEDLHNILVSLFFPYKMPATQRFNITEADRDFLFKYMSQLPTESIYPPYAADTASYWPAYCKFLLFGSEKGDLPKNIRVFNKVGDAYGQLTDVAYIADYDKKIEFFLSATIYCNNDGVLNDDKYDYDQVGLPFMKHLGEALYEYELTRKKNIQPNLSDLIFSYDKN
ncbi:MAG: serine hydrolase [Ferruginibacter sp.]